MALYRTAGPDDWEVVASVHTASWQNAYKGIMSDEFLFKVLPDKMRTKWHDRLAAGEHDSNPNKDEALTLLAVSGDKHDKVVGFVCVMVESERPDIVLLDNMHVLPEARRKGIASHLFREAKTWAEKTTLTSMYLLCFEQNQAATGLYEAMGGRRVGPKEIVCPDGEVHPVLEYHWDLAM